MHRQSRTLPIPTQVSSSRPANGGAGTVILLITYRHRIRWHRPGLAVGAAVGGVAGAVVALSYHIRWHRPGAAVGDVTGMCIESCLLFFSTTRTLWKTTTHNLWVYGYVIYSFWIVLYTQKNTRKPSKTLSLSHAGAAVKPVPIDTPSGTGRRCRGKIKSSVSHHRHRLRKTKLDVRQGLHRTDTIPCACRVVSTSGAAVAADANADADGNEYITRRKISRKRAKKIKTTTKWATSYFKLMYWSFRKCTTTSYPRG